MINKVLATTLIILLAMLFTPVDSWQSSAIIVETLGYRVSTNWIVIAGGMLTLILMWRLLIAVPRKISFYYHKICVKDRLVILLSLLSAINNHQARAAMKLFSKLQDEPSPSVKVLKVQVMQLQRLKPEKILEELKELASNNDTKIFALEEMIKIYLEQGDWKLVDECADTLWGLHPSLWLLSTRILAMVHLGAWEEIILFAKLGFKEGFLDKTNLKQLQAIAHYKVACALQEIDVGKAIKSLAQSMDMEAKHPHALMIELQIKNGNIKNGIYYAKKAWEYEPDHRISKNVMLLTYHLSHKEFYDACREITASNKDHYESLLLMARAYILLDDLIQASALLNKAMALQQDQRVYMLLARCCHLAHGSVTEIYDWLNKACNTNSEQVSDVIYWDLTTMKYSLTPSDRSIMISA